MYSARRTTLIINPPASFITMSDESGPEYIQAELLNFGVEMKLDLALKLHHLGAAYGKSDDDMVSEWFAYASSLTDGTPTLEKILAMEAKTLVKTTAPPPIRTPKITAAPAMDRSTVDVEMDDVLEAYLGEVSSGEVSFGSSAPKVAKTPTVTRNRTTALRETKQSKFTPGTYSPGSSTPSEKYQGRKDRGTIMEAVKFGEAFDPKTWKTRKPAEISVEVKLWSDLWSLTGKYTYMCDRLDIQRQVHFTAAEELGKDITEALDGGAEIFPCNYASNDDYFSIGRVFCDARGAGKLNEASICLENCSAEAPGSIVKLDVSQLAASAKNLALFPGQVVVVKGSNPTGQKLVASEIHAGLFPKVVESDFSIGENGPLRIAICSGPFTVNSNLLYEPWKDLVEEIKDLKPHVLFLFGPFIDSQNTVVNEATVEFSSIFDDLITHLTSEIDCSIAVVASSSDVFHDNVYPTPPYPSKDKYGGKVKFFADPSIIDVNGLVFACSSTDILMQLGREECSLAPGDRFYRLGEQLLKQRSFYPLYPPGVNVDYSHYEAHVDLPIRPHFMLLPSVFSPFVRRVGGTVLVNPGYLCKASSGGTFALMEIDPGFKGSEETAQGMRVRVVRI